MLRFGVLVLLVVAGGALAQPGADPATVVEQVEVAYENLDYDAAEAQARRALARFEAFTPDQLVRLHTTLGLILYARGNDLEAAEEFRAALSLDPALTLDPLLVSPVTLAFFEDTRAVLAREADAAGQDTAPVVRYIRVEDPRPAAAWRSALVPGWGQHYKGNSTKGWVLTGLWATTLAGGAYAHVQRQNAREVYLAETDPSRIAERYDTFDTWHKMRGGLLLGTAAVWIYAAADAALAGGSDSSQRASAIQVSPAPGGFVLRVRF